MNKRLKKIAKRILGREQGKDRYLVGEVRPIIPQQSADVDRPRLNLLLPSLNKKDVFGGIATALSMFDYLVSASEFDSRIILLDADIDNDMVERPGYVVSDSVCSDSIKHQIVEFSKRNNKKLAVRKRDIFMATGWWTAYSIESVIRWQKDQYCSETLPLIYMVQDYEPGFYPWSSRYIMADSTYHWDGIPVWAIINSKELYDYMEFQNASFEKKWFFEPMLNEKLREYLPPIGTDVPKKKQILVYGRPGTSRNAFELVVEGINIWAEKYPDACSWSVIAAGEEFDDFEVEKGVIIRSVGKVSLDEYAKLLLESSIGISLMVSPHPSYPPLEMSTFGVVTITNAMYTKKLDSFSDNIFTLEKCSGEELAVTLEKKCNEYKGIGTVCTSKEYLRTDNVLSLIAQEIAESFPDL